MIPYIETNGGITFILDGEPKTLSVDDPRFEQVKDMVINGDEAWEVKELLQARAKEVERVVQLTPSLSYVGGAILHNGVALHNYAVDKLIDLIDSGYPATPLINFLDKLVKNPSYRVVEHLYEFLEHGKVPLTQSGNFVAYKAIRANWMDIHSGTFDNSIGKTISVPRNAVDEDPDRTCSHGLHVCSFDYLPNFSHSNGHVVAVEVNPADVVAIPRDYNNTKMRCCSYTVVSEVTDYYNKGQNILSETPFYGAWIVSTPKEWRVEADYGYGWAEHCIEDSEEDAVYMVNLLINEDGLDGARAFRPDETEPFLTRRL